MNVRAVGPFRTFLGHLVKRPSGGGVFRPPGRRDELQPRLHPPGCIPARQR